MAEGGRAVDRMSGEVLIVGGGVIGLSIAYELARGGILSTVLDRGEMGREASWAGAGMIPPLSERATAGPLGQLRARSAGLYPEWSASLLEETDIDNGYDRTGGVDVAVTPDEDAALRGMAGRWRAEGVAYERIEPRDFERVEPALGPEVRVAYYLPDRAQIRNPDHLRALAEALGRRGCDLRPGTPVLGFEANDGRVTAARTPGGLVRCGLVVIAAGAWSGALLEGIGLSAPTPPLKGQIVLLRGDRPLLRRIVEHGKKYLVPRKDGRILIGATEEDAGFDTRPTPVGVRDLLDEALRLCPSLAGAEVERSWAGLRPGSLDARPYLGPAPGFRNVIVATGHKRAGLQLAPASAEVIVDLIRGEPPRVDLSPFRVGREPSGEPPDETYRS